MRRNLLPGVELVVLLRLFFIYMLYKTARGDGFVMLRKLILLTVVAMLFCGPALSAAAPEEVFVMWDPQGDADGPGGYIYPQHQSFPQELPMMMDLTGFRVLNTEEAVRFEFHFAAAPDLHKPWGGSGFNFHRIDLFIITGGAGSKETFRPGSMVRFAKPWQYNLRLRDWLGGYLIHWQQHDPDDPRAGVWQDQVEGFEVFVQDKMVVAEINHTLLGAADTSWKYYVLVGLQDAYGPDQYREVTQEGGLWTGGGGCDSNFNPNLYDILAETASDQYSQLSWEVGEMAVLSPVGPVSTSDRVWTAVKIGGVVMLAAGLAVLIWTLAKR